MTTMVPASLPPQGTPERGRAEESIRSAYYAGTKQIVLARQYGVSQGTISRIVGVDPLSGALSARRNQLAQSVLGRAGDLTERERRVLAILKGEVSL